MRYALAVVFSFIAVTIAPACAQQDQERGRASRIELYGGYDYIRFNINASARVLQPVLRDGLRASDKSLWNCWI